MSNPWEIQTVEYDKTNAEGNVEVSGYGQISILLNKYVLKEKGKGLSSNDFTDNDKLKLDSVEVGAEKNKLETLTINGGTKIYPNDEKNINLPIPTKVSQLDNDLGYAKLINMSHDDNFSDSYVGKAKFAFQEEESLAIGKNAIADVRGVAIGADTSINEVYDVNINNELLHNAEENIWEGKITEADKAFKNDNGTNLTELDVVIDDLATEIENRKNADEILQNNINTEIQNRTDADNTLQNDINAEIQNRIEADINLTNSLNDEIQNRISEDDLLEINLNTEIQNRTDVDTNLSNRITHIEDLLPNQASSSNQLADKSFVNSSIQTNTANFRGNWNTWSDVPSDNVDLYPQDYAGSRIPTVNDYLVVKNASDYTANTLSGTWRFKYGGVWETDGKNGWIPEYQVNEEPLTSEQVYAINSGITSDKVSSYDAHLIDTSNPHSVTKSQVGLGDVINSGDSAIPIEGGTTKFTTGGAYTELAKKVDKVEGKGLSTNDFTDTYKNKLDNIDTTVTTNSSNLVTSGAVATAISTAETNANNGFNSSTTTDSTPGWGYLTSDNGYSNGRTYGFANGGGIATAEKDTKSSLQVDGDLYVHEGLDKVATLNDIPTSLPANGGTADSAKMLKPFAYWNNPYLYDPTNGTRYFVFKITMPLYFNSILIQIYGDINYALSRKYILGLWHYDGYGYNVSVTDLGGTINDALRVWLGNDGNVYLQTRCEWTSNISFSYLEDTSDITIDKIGSSRLGSNTDLDGNVLFTPLTDPIIDCGAIEGASDLSSASKVRQYLKADKFIGSTRIASVSNHTLIL